MKKDIVGLIFTGERIDQMRDLTRTRAVAALPMLGRYRMIDFMMANMIHSGMHNVGIIMQKNYHSLMDHLGSGREWDMHGKRSGMTILPPYMSSDNFGAYEGLLDALRSNLNFMRRSTERYIAVSDSYILFNTDYEKMLEEHLANNADITLLYSKHRNARRNGAGVYLELDGESRVKQLEIAPGIPRYENTYLSSFIMRRELLIDMVDRAASSGYHHFTRELLNQILRENYYKVFACECKEKVWILDSVDSYFKTNMDFLDPDNRVRIFDRNKPVWTKLRDEMPALYAQGASVSNSLIADGCVIEGQVENSILFRGVSIKKGAVVKNSIIMQDAFIQRNVEVQNCILDKQVIVRENVRLVSSPTYPIVVSKNSTI
ncbi:MAG: glucose-1-phosphate adenylyltransferase subunit GlgD [Clostridiales bacterium]|nr:glucose-1-phosphate adenylyltransferase subunit GlgD [Clostridiales bacterium]